MLDGRKQLKLHEARCMMNQGRLIWALLLDTGGHKRAHMGPRLRRGANKLPGPQRIGEKIISSQFARELGEKIRVPISKELPPFGCLRLYKNL